MQTTPLTPATAADTLRRSVVAVPPLARHNDLTLNREANARLIEHIETGGVSTLLYGGNANLYNVAVSEYAAILDFLAGVVKNDTLVIPSVGPDYGKMIDQAAVLRDRDFPTAMVLPAAFGSTPAGVATGIRRFVNACGKPVVLYIKSDGYVDVDTVKQLVDDKLVSVIKYAIVRPSNDQPHDDPYLKALVDAVDKSIIMSGIGEQPAIVHLRDFGLGGFTSGCVCIAPALSMAMMRAIHANDIDEAERIRLTFKPLEDLRNAHSPIRVLHEAVTLAGIADMGPILPLLSNLESEHHDAVREAATQLLQDNASVSA